VGDRQAPPVNEVALAVGFAPEDLLLGPLLPQVLGPWFQDRDQITIAPPYEMPLETPSGQDAWSGNAPPFEIRAIATPEPRYWITSGGDVYVLQVQRDYIALNWRRRNPTQEYVHFDALRARFADILSTVQGNLAAMGRALAPNKAELTYVNLIEPNEIWSSPSETHHLLNLRFPDEDDYEQISLSYAKEMRNESGAFVGRLRVNLQPSTDWATQQARLNLNLTARSGQLTSKTAEDALDFLDVAHELANETFLGLLTDEAAANWGLR